MSIKKRLYDVILAEHLAQNRQMAFVSGPRQVGKTTTCKNLSTSYLNWDNTDDRAIIISGPAAVAETIGLNTLQKHKPVALFDELHKFARWKQFLKGFFDVYADRLSIVVTGSSRMDIYRRGGDSLMGRYFLYRMHPLSVGELASVQPPDIAQILRTSAAIPDEDFAALWTHGGFPEPFLKRDDRFSRRWRMLRQQQFLREDVRDLTQIHQFDQLEALVNLLMSRSSCQLIYSNLAAQVQVSTDTLRRWIGTLCNLHLGFLIRPWFKNVARSLRKEPKWFLRDWSLIDDPGQKAETFVACHLLKAVQGWTDLGFGAFELCYLRDTQQREVDFVVVKDGQPWFIVEVKNANEKLSPALVYFQKQLNAPFAFQVVLDAEAVNADCFTHLGRAIVVPARTFLSHLL